MNGPRTDGALTTKLTVVAVLAGSLLRCYVALTNATVADELYESVYSRQPLGWILVFSTHDDTHGPLDYLIRHFFVDGHNIALLRLPSLVFAVASLIAVGWWMRERSWFGFMVTAFTAASPFLVLYGIQARMYSSLILCGTLTAWFADRWLQTKATKWCVLVAGVLAFGVLSDNTAVFLAAGAFLVPGLARDRAAWLWRGAIASSGVVFLVLLGPTLHHRIGNPPPFVSLATPESGAVALNGLVTIFYPHYAWLVVALFVVGGVALWRLQPPVWQVAFAVAVVPFIATFVVGMRIPMLIPRTLAFAGWVAPVLLAAVAEAARRRIGAMGAALVALVVAMLMWPSLYQTLQYGDGAEESVEAMTAFVEPGDAVASYPHFIRYLLAWGFDTSVDATLPTDMDIADSYYAIPGTAPPTGRVWLLTDNDLPLDDTGLRRCPGEETRHMVSYTANCYLAPLRRS